MRKTIAVVSLVGILVVWFNVQRFFLIAQGPQKPLTDTRFCVDANGDGRIDVSDAITILNFLFSERSTPYCVAQGTSLDNFATRDEVSALKARLDTIEATLQSVGSIASGTYVGDGKQDRVIDTGLNGTIRFVRVWLAPTIDQGPLFGGILTKIDLMAGKISDTFGAAIEGSSFTVDARFRTGSGDFNPTNLNEAGKTYIWIAIVTPQ